MMNMNLLAVITPLYIYHGFSIKFAGEENFTLGDFTAANMKLFSHPNVRKQREIKGSDKYITLYISLKFGSM